MVNLLAERIKSTISIILLLQETPMMIRIIPFTTATRDFVRKLNYEWLEKYFRVEPNDALHLSDPETYILAKGGDIFYAEEGGDIIGTYSLLKLDEGVYELGKMATTASAQGKGVGNLMIAHCIEEARKRTAVKLIL